MENNKKKPKMAVVRPIHKRDKNSLITDGMCVITQWPTVPGENMPVKHCNVIAKYNILTRTQYGFREHIGSCGMLGDFSDYVNKHMNHWKYVRALFIDFTKACEMINHEILLERVYRTGIRGKTWFGHSDTDGR